MYLPIQPNGGVKGLFRRTTDERSIRPKPNSVRFAIRQIYRADSIVFSVLEFARVFGAAGECIGALTVEPVVQETATVFVAVRVSHRTLAAALAGTPDAHMHLARRIGRGAGAVAFAVFPFANIFLAFGRRIGALPVWQAIMPLAGVLLASDVGEGALVLILAIDEGAIVFTSVGVGVDAVAIAFVVVEFPDIFRAVGVGVGTLAVAVAVALNSAPNNLKFPVGPDKSWS